MQGRNCVFLWRASIQGAEVFRFFHHGRDAAGLHAVFLQEMRILHMPAEDDVVFHKAMLFALRAS